jgi:hypothetical protein
VEFLRKPVIALGEAGYCIEGLCYPVKAEQQLSEVISPRALWGVDIDLVEKFL